MWFAGSHGNVGGGLKDTGLSDIALDWMAQRAGELGLDIDPAELGTRPQYDAPLHESYSRANHALDLLEGEGRLLRTIGRPDKPGDAGDVYRTYETAGSSAERRLTEHAGTPPYDAPNLALFLARRTAAPQPT